MYKTEFENRWLSDGIGEEYKKWKNKYTKVVNVGAARVFIESPTGTGKTTFILDKLLPFAMKNNETILYLSNRNALREQIERKASSKLMCLNTYEKDTETIRYYGAENSTNLIIVNYHSFFKYIDEIVYPHESKVIDYIILDEGHFFLEDSLFNTKTCEILDVLLKTFSESVMVFMSATIRDLYNIWTDVVKKINTAYQSVGKPYIQAENTFYYCNNYQKSSYQLFYFFKNEELIYKIRNTPNSEKWLIFTMSKNQGKNLQNQFPKKKVKFITAGSKGNKTWKTIVETEEFLEDILISTMVLDNGINIKATKDKNGKIIKHIVLPACYEVEFIQMLGRIRLKGNETISVYIQMPSVQSINREIWKYQEFAEKISRYKLSIESVAKMTSLIRECWRNGRTDINSLFYIDAKRDLVANPLAEHKIDIMLTFYRKLKADCHKPDFYLLLVQIWLQGKIINSPSHIFFNNCKNIKEICEKYKNFEINEEMQLVFYEGLLFNLKIYCFYNYGAESNIYESFLKIRKGTDQRKATLNRAFKILQIPYKITKKNNCWIMVDRE